MQRKIKADIAPVMRLLLLAAVLFGGLFAFQGEAFASPSWNTTYGDTTVSDGSGNFCPDRKDGLAGRVVYCIQAIVIRAVENFLDAFLPLYTSIIVATMTLAVTLYGALYLSGNIRRPAADTMLLALKIGGVFMFTVGFGNMAGSVFDVMEGLANIVSNYVITSPGISLCSQNNALPLTMEMRPDHGAWDKIDCMFVTLLGIGATATAAAGMVALLGGLLFSGGIGLIIFLMGIMFMLTLLMTVVRAIKVYLHAVVAVAFLICISPITIPCILFSASRDIFDRWRGQLMAHMLIPIFIMAYLSMIVAAIDAIIFRGPSSLYYAIAREPSQELAFDFMKWLDTGDDGYGNEIGKDVPGTNALALLGYIDKCETGTAEEKEAVGELCDDMDQLRAMQRCAVNPWVADDSGTDMPEIDTDAGETCEDIPDKMGGRGKYYFGFMTNVELLAYSITPGIETDEARREREKGCSGFFCAIGNVVGAVWNAATWVVGQVTGAIGAVFNFLGDVLKGFANFLSTPCRLLSGVAGDICNFATGATAINIIGDVVHFSGSVTNFGSRVLLDGFMAALGLDRIDGYFDVVAIDVQKIAAYRCKLDMGITATNDMAYIDGTCPGTLDLLVELVYVIITAVIVIFLMMKWLPYVPVMAHALTANTTYISSHIPGENMLQSRLRDGAQSLSSQRVRFAPGKILGGKKR